MADENYILKSEELFQLPIHVAKITVHGLSKTKNDVISNALESTLYCTSLSSLATSLELGIFNLQSMNIFKSISSRIESLGGLDVEIVLDVEEKKYRLSTGTDISAGEISWNAGGYLANIFGRGEHLEASASLGTQSSVPFQVSFIKPLIGSRLRAIKTCLYEKLHHYLNSRSYKDGTTGFCFGILFPSRFGLHELNTSIEWRQLYGMNESSSNELRHLAGHSIKSSISHIISRGTRDESVFPRQGYFVQIKTEIAGALGDTQFIKNEIHMQHNASINSFTLRTSLRQGLLYNFSQSPLCFLDKFFVGGPLSVRGFTLGGIGPRVKNDSLGGNLFLEGGLSLFFPITLSTASFLLGHSFINSGSVITASSGSTLFQSVKETLFNQNISIGVGLTFKLMSTAKLEVNVAYPLRLMGSSLFHRGVHFGIGLDFL